MTPMTRLAVAVAACTGLVAAGPAVGATTVRILQAEAMISAQGGIAVQVDPDAAGGKRLRVFSGATVRGTVTLPSATASLVVRAKAGAGATGALRMRVSVDGTTLPDITVRGSRWADHGLTAAMAKGAHTVAIRLLNPSAGDLHLDRISFLAPTPPPAGERTVTAYVTGYSYWDNTPPGSPAISHPVVHRVAGGTGTYADPVTIAVGHTIQGGTDTLDWPAGTRFYLPYLRRYVMVEDTCGDGPTPQNGPCHVGYPAPATTWLDIWADGRELSAARADACLAGLTDVHTAVLDPRPGYLVDPGPVIRDGACPRQYGETPVTG